jgi:uncharacterized membrane protein YkoI
LPVHLVCGHAAAQKTEEADPMARISKSFVGLFALGLLTTAWLAANAAEVEKTIEIKEVKVKYADCPAAVQKTIQREVIGATINDMFVDSHDDTAIYRAEVTLDDKNYDILVAKNGTLLEKVLQTGDEPAEVAFSDLPRDVRKTFKREALGAKIKNVIKQNHSVKTTYELFVKVEGLTYEVKVAEDGTLISKVLDGEDKEEDKEAVADTNKVSLATHEETLTAEMTPLTILRCMGLELTLGEGAQSGRKMKLRIEGENIEIKTTKSGVLISVGADDE